MSRTLEAQARFRRDVLEFSLAEILEQDIAHPHRRDKQVRPAVVVDVSKGSADADLVGQSDSGAGGDILKPAAAQIPPKLVAPDLIDEIDIEPPISVHVRYGHPGAVIIMNGLVILGRIVHRVLFKADAAFLATIRELEVMKRFPSRRGLNLLSFVLLQR